MKSVIMKEAQLKNPFSMLFRARDKPGRRPSPEDSISSAPNFYFGTSGAGKSVTVSSAIQMSTVYACVRAIAETVASLPLHVYEITDKGSMKAAGHPLYRVLHDEPNAEMSSLQHGKADLFFQRIHHVGQAGLRIAKDLGCLGEAAEIHGKEKRLQFFAVHRKLLYMRKWNTCIIR